MCSYQLPSHHICISLTLVIGPEMEDPVERLLGEALVPEYVELPEWEEPAGLLDTKPAMDWLTPEARMKFSRSSTLVRPLAARDTQSVS